jgi:hypothetical protein
VLLEGDRVQITVSLTDPFDDKPLWTQSYERSLRDVVSWQPEAPRTIAQQIDAAPHEEMPLQGRIAPSLPRRTRRTSGPGRGPG